MTGLVLVTTIMKNPAINIDEAVNGGELTTMAFGQIPFSRSSYSCCRYYLICVFDDFGMGVLR